MELLGPVVAILAGLGRESGHLVVDQVAEGFQGGLEAEVTLGAARVLVGGGGGSGHAGAGYRDEAAGLLMEEALQIGADGGRAMLDHEGRAARGIAEGAQDMGKEETHVGLLQAVHRAIAPLRPDHHAVGKLRGAEEIERVELQRTTCQALVEVVDEVIVPHVIEEVVGSDPEVGTGRVDQLPLACSGAASDAGVLELELRWHVVGEIPGAPSVGNPSWHPRPSRW